MALLKAQAQRGLTFVIAAVLCVPLCLPMISGAVDIGSTDEYRVKAAFLLNFLKFAQWPDAEGLATRSSSECFFRIRLAPSSMKRLAPRGFPAGVWRLGGFASWGTCGVVTSCSCLAMRSS